MKAVAEILTEELADLYWRASSDHPDGPNNSHNRGSIHAAFDAVDILMRVPRIGAWLVLALAALADADYQRAFLAAGPFEDLLERADLEDLTPLDNAFASDPRLVDCLYRMNEPESAVGRAWLSEKRAAHPRPKMES